MWIVKNCSLKRRSRLLDLSSDFIPFASLIAGLSGSLHCLGMCGGLVTASCNGGKDVLKYQLGRFLGYTILGSLAFLLGDAVKSVLPSSWIPLISGILLGTLFIYWGVQSYRGKKAELPLPGFLHHSYRYLFRNFAGKSGNFRSFVTGLLSLMLPCGLIYGIVIAATALGDYHQMILSLFFFWLGTLPAMIGAPHIVKKILNPFRQRLPKIYAIVFIVVGVATIAGRLQMISPSQGEAKIHHCH